MKSLLLTSALAALISLNANADITVQQAYIRSSAPGAPTGAAFMRLSNTGPTPLSLDGARTERAAASELHNHVSDNGVLRMRRVETIEVPAGGSVELEPGGYHLMLMGLQRPLREGETVPVTLHFSDGSEQRLQLPVQRNAPASTGAQHPHGVGHPPMPGEGQEQAHPHGHPHGQPHGHGVQRE